MDAPRVPSHGGITGKNGLTVPIEFAHLYLRPISTIDPCKFPRLLSFIRANVKAERPPVARCKRSPA